MENTYNPRAVVVTVTPIERTVDKNGNSREERKVPIKISGFAEDSFITIDDKSNGVTSKVGCDGEVIRTVDPSRQHTISITLLQNSASNDFFEKMYVKDRNHKYYGNGEGMFVISIKDLSGAIKFASAYCWVTKETQVSYGRDSSARQWVIDTYVGHFSTEAGAVNVNSGKVTSYVNDYKYN